MKEKCYEAVFLNNEEIKALFKQMRGEKPFDNETKDFHVTTEYMPEICHPEFYGEEVSVHITAYKIGTVRDNKGNLTKNEGFKAFLNSENPELQRYFDSLDKNYHITGAFEKAPEYTELVDFSDGEPLDIYTKGIFKCQYINGDKTYIDSVGLSVGTYNSLKRAGYNYLEKLEGKSLRELYKIRNLGRNGAEEVIRICKDHGITTGI